MAVNLQSAKVLDTWNSLIENGAGRTQQFFDIMSGFLTNAAIPSLTWEFDSTVYGRIGMYQGVKREYIVVNHTDLRDYHMYITARDYGTFLEVSWALTAEPGFFNKTFAKLAPGIHALTTAGLDYNEQMELGAYTCAVSEAVKYAVEKILKELDQDVSKLTMRSRTGLVNW